jgi:HAD superfamily hydrolase (TIGR01450 family)
VTADRPARAEPSLSARYRGVVCDLDGVVYRGHERVPHAVEALEGLRAAGHGVVYATNNASRTPQEVAAQLASLGLTLTADDVVTSSQAGAARLAGLLPAGTEVLAVGGPGVLDALREVGLTPVRSDTVAARATGAGRPGAAARSGDGPEGGGRRGDGAGGEPVGGARGGVPIHGARVGEPARVPGSDGAVAGVLQGYGPLVAWADLAEAAYAVQAGAVWVATNVDTTLPTARGLAPGNGTLVEAVRQATGVEPVVVGKPHTPLYDLSAQVLGVAPDETLAIGDRLDTDIAGANAAGMPSLLVLTGVHGLREAARATAAERPRYLAMDLRALAEPYAEAVPSGGGWSCGGARAELGEDGTVHLTDGGSPDERLRCAVAALWSTADAGTALPGPDDEVWDRLVDAVAGRGVTARPAQ